MNPQLTMAAANSHYEDLLRSADQRRLAAGQTSPSYVSRVINKLGFVTRRPRSTPATATVAVSEIAPQH